MPFPAPDAFAPEVLLVSAGFDGPTEDPLARIEVDEDDFVWITVALMSLPDSTQRRSHRSFSEGSYNFSALGGAPLCTLLV